MSVKIENRNHSIAFIDLDDQSNVLYEFDQDKRGMNISLRGDVVFINNRRVRYQDVDNLDVSSGTELYNKLREFRDVDAAIDAKIYTVAAVNSNNITTTKQDIWFYGGTIDRPTGQEVLNVQAASANDDATGTGIRMVYIEGVDANYNLVSEVVSLNGAGGVNTTAEFMDVNIIIVAATGSAGVAQGNILVQQNSSNKVLGVIPTGYRFSGNSHITIPAGMSGVIKDIEYYASKDASGNDTFLMNITKQEENGAEVPIWGMPIDNTSNVSNKTIVLEEKTRVKATGINLVGGTNAVSFISYCVDLYDK